MATTVITPIPALCYSFNFPDIIVEATAEVTVILKKAGIVDPILTENYQPSSGGTFTIKLYKLLTSLLTVNVPDAPLYIQDAAMADFTITIDGIDYPTRIIKGGVRDLITDYAAFFSANFLTNQKRQKDVKYFEPSYLSYYSEIATTLKAYTIWRDLDGFDHPEEITIADLLAGNLYTIDVTFDRIRQLFPPAAVPTYIDVYVDARTYVQRYLLTNNPDQYDDCFLFENSMGGLDVVRYNGQLEEIPESESESAMFGDILTEYFCEYKRKFKKFTGYLSGSSEALQTNAFFISSNRYHYRNDIPYRIIVGKQSGSTITGQLNTSDFEFNYADDKAILAIDRAQWNQNESGNILSPPNPDFNDDFSNDFLTQNPTKTPGNYGF